jgi:hypothetical protein
MESSTSGLSGSGELVKRGSLESAEEYNKVGREYYSQKNYVAATEQFGHAISKYADAVFILLGPCSPRSIFLLIFFVAQRSTPPQNTTTIVRYRA